MHSCITENILHTLSWTYLKCTETAECGVGVLVLVLLFVQRQTLQETASDCRSSRVELGFTDSIFDTMVNKLFQGHTSYADVGFRNWIARVLTSVQTQPQTHVFAEPTHVLCESTWTSEVSANRFTPRKELRSGYVYNCRQTSGGVHSLV